MLNVTQLLNSLSKPVDVKAPNSAITDPMYAYGSTSHVVAEKATPVMEQISGAERVPELNTSVQVSSDLPTANQAAQAAQVAQVERVQVPSAAPSRSVLEQIQGSASVQQTTTNTPPGYTPPQLSVLQQVFGTTSEEANPSRQTESKVLFGGQLTL